MLLADLDRRDLGALCGELDPEGALVRAEVEDAQLGQRNACDVGDELDGPRDATLGGVNVTLRNRVEVTTEVDVLGRPVAVLRDDFVALACEICWLHDPHLTTQGAVSLHSRRVPALCGRQCLGGHVWHAQALVIRSRPLSRFLCRLCAKQSLLDGRRVYRTREQAILIAVLVPVFGVLMVAALTGPGEAGVSETDRTVVQVIGFMFLAAWVLIG